MHNADMKLQAYLAEHRLDDLQFATVIGRDRSTVYRLRTGRTRPDWQTIAAIVEATKGAVTADDFMPDAGDDPRPFAGRGADAA
jgi:transcriptional regulator with XRE-family HTH domain